MHEHVSSLQPTTDVRRLEPGIALVVLSGEHDLDSAPELSRTLGLQLEHCSHLIVDLSAADFVDSSTITTLVNAKNHADQAGCRFNLVLASTPIVERALEITGVLPHLNRVKTLDQALAPLAGRPSRLRPGSGGQIG